MNSFCNCLWDVCRGPGQVVGDTTLGSKAVAATATVRARSRMKVLLVRRQDAAALKQQPGVKAALLRTQTESSVLDVLESFVSYDSEVAAIDELRKSLAAASQSFSAAQPSITPGSNPMSARLSTTMPTYGSGAMSSPSNSIPAAAVLDHVAAAAGDASNRETGLSPPSSIRGTSRLSSFSSTSLATVTAAAGRPAASQPAGPGGAAPPAAHPTPRASVSNLNPSKAAMTISSLNSSGFATPAAGHGSVLPSRGSSSTRFGIISAALGTVSTATLQSHSNVGTAAGAAGGTGAPAADGGNVVAAAGPAVTSELPKKDRVSKHCCETGMAVIFSR